MIKILHLFSGTGSVEQALKNLGIEFENVAHCEIDKYADTAYKMLHGENSRNLGDVTKVDWNEFKDKNIDLIFGGFPCQTFSIAGNRAGFDDLRGTMCFHMANAIKIIKPKYWIFENVEGLLSHDNGNTIKHILEIFGSLGYAITMDLLNSKDYGIPQNRSRVFCIGRKIDEIR